MLTIKDVCEKYKITKPTLYKWLKLGCPVHTIGYKKYFMQDEVEEWIKSK